eukprot:gene4413-7788_t
MEQQTEKNDVSNKVEEENEMINKINRGLISLLSFQLISKIFTFLMNTFIITRNINAETKGIIFTFEFFSNTILFLSRESFRRISRRINFEKKKEKEFILNLNLYEIPIGIIILIIGYLLFFIQIINNKDKYNEFPNLEYFLIFYSISTFIEILNEPFYILNELKSNYKFRVQIEGISLFFKMLIISFFLKLNQNFLFGFCISQIIFSIFLISFYFKKYKFEIFYYTNDIQDDSNLNIESNSNPDTYTNIDTYTYPNTNSNTNSNTNLKVNTSTILTKSTKFNIFISFFYQTLLKFLLSEGEKFFLFLFSSLKDQGIYDLTSNLGSLVARILFQPIEEISNTSWSKLLNKQEEKKNKRIENLKLSKEMLIQLLKFLILIGYYFIFFGPSYSNTLIYILHGNKWSINASKILSFYCIYVMLLPLNGITESFIQAESNENNLKRFNYFMILFSFIYLISIYIFVNILNFGIYSFIISNCLNMLMRIIFSYFYILNFWNQNKISFSFNNIIPNIYILFYFLFSFILTKYLEIINLNRIIHLFIGFILFLISIYLIWKKEKEMIRKLKNIFFKNKVD